MPIWKGCRQNSEALERWIITTTSKNIMEAMIKDKKSINYNEDGNKFSFFFSHSVMA